MPGGLPPIPDPHELVRAVAHLAHRRGHLEAAQSAALRAAPDASVDSVERHLEAQGLSPGLVRELIHEVRALVGRVERIAGTGELPSPDDRVLRDGLARGVIDRRQLLVGMVVEASGGDAAARSVSEMLAGQATLVGADSGASPPHAMPETLHAPRPDRPTIGPAAAPPRDSPLLGRYPMSSRLGAGGMGEVYAVFDLDLNREVAAKVIRGEVDARHLQKFVLEAQITGQLQHPSIVPVYELGRTPEGRLYFTMKKIEGRTLAAMLAEDYELDHPSEGRPRSTPTASAIERSTAGQPPARRESADAPRRDPRLFEKLGVMLKVCEAVAFAHSKGVIHRDLKPDNVMIGEFGEVLVCDWGLAKVLTRHAREDHAAATLTPAPIIDDGVVTLVGDVMGTPAYMPPEQAQGRLALIDERADIYALGAMLYQVLSGEPPYVGSTASAVLEQVIATRPIPLAERSPMRSIPWELEAVVSRAMERLPAKRYASVTALKADLEAFLGGKLVAAAHYTPIQRATKLARRHGRLLAAAGIASVSLLAASIYVAVSARAQLQEVQAAEREAQANLDDAKRMGSMQALRDVERDALALWWTRLNEQTGTLRDSPDVGRLRAVDLEIEAWKGHATRLLDQTDALVTAANAAARDRDSSPKDTWFAFRAKVMADLVAGLRELADLRSELGLRQERFRRWLIEHDARAPAWHTAALAIEASPRYAGLRLEPQVGLVPLGPNPHSGLWLFAVAGTGAIPADATALADDTAVVLVLIPAGRYRIGATAGAAGDHQDPQAFSHEGPDHEVTLQPYFIGRTELTQHQWNTLTRTRPSRYPAGQTEIDRPITERHPVESVNWDECAQELSRIGLVLPSEVQWEAATRGGRGTIYWTGNDPAGLARLENLADALAKRADPSLMTYEAWEDGHFIHAPVGSYPDGENPFGLVDVHGNVREWCRDAYDARAYDKPADVLGDRPPPANADVRLRVFRGGSWAVASRHARASYRYGHAPALRDDSVGLRASRFVTGMSPP